MRRVGRADAGNEGKKEVGRRESLTSGSLGK